MNRLLIICFLVLAFARTAAGQDSEPVADSPVPEATGDSAAEAGEADDSAAEAPAVTAEDGTRTMSGMSVLGNEEAPKSLVIIPWKSSEIGSDLGLSDTLDDRARPVDKEVFLRELRFYEIRADEAGVPSP